MKVFVTGENLWSNERVPVGRRYPGGAGAERLAGGLITECRYC